MMTRQARASLTEFAELALAAVGQTPARHHRLLIEKLEAVERGDIKRLMIFMPPGSAKSTYASVIFPAWYASRNPHAKIIGASHTADLSEEFSRRIQTLVTEHADILGYSLRNTNVSYWGMTNNCTYKAVGVDAPIAGRRGSLVIIDDPVKSRADADSQTYRDKTYKWYLADIRPRLRPGASVVLISTRWHESDLPGRLLEDNPGQWTVIKLPAIAMENDQLGRAIGEPLWNDDPNYSYGAELAGIRDELGERDWWSLYQQSPRPISGGIFKIGKIEIIDAEPAGLSAVRAWDLAATSATGTRDPDYTAGVKLARTPSGSFVVCDVVRIRGGPEEVEATIMATASRDGRRVPVLLPQDPGQAGKQQVAYLTRRLSGYVVRSGVESGDKSTRAMPVSSQCNVGNLSLVRGAWNRAFIDELASFPGGHDDQVDAMSRAFADVSDNSVVERFKALSL